MRQGIFFILLPFLISKKNFRDDIRNFREKYIQEHLRDEHSPIKEKEATQLRFYKPNIKYRVQGLFTKIYDSKGFIMETYSGKKKHYYTYGKVEFRFQDKVHALYIYQSKKLMENEKYADYLFIPFKDRTNYKTTYGGGRYLDLKTSDIHNRRIALDFNKSYNPYCAYAGGYSCPIPPTENHLPFSIKAGEKKYRGSTNQH